MCQNYYVRKLSANVVNVVESELLVHFAAARPTNHLIIQFRAGKGARVFGGKDDVPAGLPGDVLCQILVGKKNDGVSIQRFNYGGRIGRGATNVRLGFDVRVSIDIGDHRNAWKLPL